MKHYVGLCLILVTLACLGLWALHSCTSAVNDTVDHVRKAFSDVLHIQPEVTLNQRVVLTQTAPIAELAVVTKEELVTTGVNEHLEVLSYQIPLTEKKLTAEATYRIKAGFDLREPFSVHIDSTMHALVAQMPHAKILSIEQIGQIEYHGEDATLNRITDKERIELLANLNTAAHDAAENSSIKKDAEEQVVQRLDELMGHNGQSLEIKWKEISPLAKPK